MMGDGYLVAGIAPANDGPGNGAYQAMRHALAAVTAEEKAR